VTKLRDTIPNVDGIFEFMQDTPEGVVILRQDKIGINNSTIILQRANVDYEYIVEGI